MDPIAHTFVGAALAGTGLRKAAPAATAALLIGANVPDVDVLAGFLGDYRSLELRRGWTHGLLALAIWPLVVTGLLLLWERWRRAQGPPSDPRRLLAVSALAVLTHPTLDWLNNYGLRWLMPFDDRWFYGDALFIIDPWVWLVLGGAVCLRHSERPFSIAGWTVFWLGASALMYANAPRPALAIWTLGLAVLVVLRLRGNDSATRPARLERSARAAVGIIVLYMVACALGNLPARSQARAVLTEAGIGPLEDLMVAPTPANPFAGFVVAATPGAYHIGTWQWFARPRLVLDGTTIETRLDEPAVRAAIGTEPARRFLVWSRYPYADVARREDGGYSVAFGDARYTDNARLLGPVVQLDRNLEPINGDAK